MMGPTVGAGPGGPSLIYPYSDPSTPRHMRRTLPCTAWLGSGPEISEGNLQGACLCTNAGQATNRGLPPFHEAFAVPTRKCVSRPSVRKSECTIPGDVQTDLATQYPYRPFEHSIGFLHSHIYATLSSIQSQPHFTPKTLCLGQAELDLKGVQRSMR